IAAEAQQFGSPDAQQLVAARFGLELLFGVESKLGFLGLLPIFKLAHGLSQNGSVTPPKPAIVMDIGGSGPQINIGPCKCDSMPSCCKAQESPCILAPFWRMKRPILLTSQRQRIRS